jgi:hypothetical protein
MSVGEETCTQCKSDGYRHWRNSMNVPVPPCQYSPFEKICYFLKRDILNKVPECESYDNNEEYLLFKAPLWFKYSHLTSTAELDQLLTDFPNHVHRDLDLFQSNAYVRWLFSVGAGDRAMDAITRHKIAFEEDVVVACIENKANEDAHAVQLIRDPGFTLAEVAVVPAELKSRAELRRMKAEWAAGAKERLYERREYNAFYAEFPDDDDPEAEEQFDYFAWERLPITEEAKRLASLAGTALAAAVRQRNFQLTIELLVKGARATDVVWFDDPDAEADSAAQPGQADPERSFVSTSCIGRGLFKSILEDFSASFDDKKVWIALLGQFGVYLDYQYYSTVFQLSVAHEHERLHWLEAGSKYKANAFPHHLIDAMQHPLEHGYVQWWHAHRFPCITKNDIYLQGSSLVRLPEENRALVTQLFGLVFPKRMDSHALDLKPTHEVGGECTCRGRF